MHLAAVVDELAQHVLRIWGGDIARVCYSPEKQHIRAKVLRVLCD